MKIAPISNSNLCFSGIITNYQVQKGKDDLKKNSYWHKSSSVEDAVGVFHSNYTGKAYFAEPMEFVNDAIKDKVDFVVYDNEPCYPALEDVKENYLGKLRKNFRENYEEMREYFYRREKGGHANIQEAQAKQREAATLTGLYDKAGDARFRKENLEDRLDVISKNIAQKKNEIDLLSSKIKSKEVEKSIWETKKENYKLKSGKYGELSVLAENTIEKDKQEINFINKQVDNLKTCIEKCKKSIEQCVKDIEQNKIRIALKNNEIGELHSEEINNKKMLDTIIEKELKPMFQSLKEFYKSQSITRILRIK